MINCHTGTAKETPYRSTLRDPRGKAEPTIGAGHCKSSQTRLTQWDSYSVRNLENLEISYLHDFSLWVLRERLGVKRYSGSSSVRVLSESSCINISRVDTVISIKLALNNSVELLMAGIIEHLRHFSRTFTTSDSNSPIKLFSHLKWKNSIKS
ncbi:hypothetical protein H8356DRAFT_1429817 [Neocallimastix lanati (nom. inval.)]|nr:hypothetical protein H8356DRAFT_1429817 [Neocallimastix sp. JGI-2020a]